jgi:DNA-binding transcriptional LysR family regulator
MIAMTFITCHTEWVELRQLTCFVTVARHAHFTRAAAELHVAQPAVSAQIRRLEAELGAELFQRTTRSVALTEAGAAFLTRAQRALDELTAARADLDRLTGVLRGRVVLGAVQSLGRFDLPDCLATFHRTHPAVRVALTSGNSRRMLRSVRSGELDLALTPLPAELREPPADLAVRELFSDELVLVLPVDHPLAGRAALPIEALATEPFVAMPETSDLRRILTGLATSAGFTPEVRFESTDTRRMRDLTAAGLGVTLLARSVAEAPGSPVAVLPLAPQPLFRPLCLVSKQGRRTSAVLDVFGRFLAEQAQRGATTDSAPGTQATVSGSRTWGSPSA